MTHAQRQALIRLPFPVVRYVDQSRMPWGGCLVPLADNPDLVFDHRDNVALFTNLIRDGHVNRVYGRRRMPLPNGE